MDADPLQVRVALPGCKADRQNALEFSEPGRVERKSGSGNSSSMARQRLRWGPLSRSLRSWPRREPIGKRLFDLRLPTWPEPGSWFFNPFAWPLVFTIGLVCGVLWRRGPPRPSVGLVALSGAVLLAALIATGAAGLAPDLRDAASAPLDVAKQDLGLARLGHFIALAYLVSVAPGFARLAEGTVGRAVQRLGAQQLGGLRGGLAFEGRRFLTLALRPEELQRQPRASSPTNTTQRRSEAR